MYGMGPHGKIVGKMKLLTALLIISLASCRPATQNVTRVEFDSLKTNLLIQVDAKVESTAVRVVPAFIGKAMGLYVQQLSDSLLILKKLSAAQAKEIAVLRSIVTKHNDTLVNLKRHVMVPNRMDFIVDTVSGLLSIKRTVK